MATYPAVKYCNLTTDLSRAYAGAHDIFKGQKTLKGYKPYTTENVFFLPRSGYIEAMYEDKVKMTEVASIVLVNSAQEWFWDSVNDVLYFYPTGGMAANHVYLAGESVLTAKEDAVKIASRDAESLLDARFTVPIPRSPAGDAANPYDRDFTDAVAKIAVGRMLGRSQVAEFEYDASGAAVGALNDSARLILEGQRIIKEYNSGTRRFSWEITKDEIGGHNLTPSSTNTSAGVIQFRGLFNPDTILSGSLFDDDSSIVADPIWLLKISTGGVLGTSQFQVSKDGGTTWSTAVATTNAWTHISNNVWVRFLAVLGAAGDFIVNDTWTIELNAPGRETTRSGIISVPVVV